MQILKLENGKKVVSTMRRHDLRHEKKIFNIRLGHRMKFRLISASFNRELILYVNHSSAGYYSSHLYISSEKLELYPEEEKYRRPIKRLHARSKRELLKDFQKILEIYNISKIVSAIEINIYEWHGKSYCDTLDYTHFYNVYFFGGLI